MRVSTPINGSIEFDICIPYGINRKRRKNQNIRAFCNIIHHTKSYHVDPRICDTSFKKETPICHKIQQEFGVERPHQWAPVSVPLSNMQCIHFIDTMVPRWLAHQGCGECSSSICLTLLNVILVFVAFGPSHALVVEERN